MSKTHHLLGPSSAPRWLKCIGSVIPKPAYVPAGGAAREGTVCHELLEAALVGMNHSSMIGMGKVVDGEIIRIDQEMVDAVDMFLDTVNALVDEFSLDRDRLQSEQYFVAHPLFGGTCDFYLFQNNRLIVIDFKYGRKPVHARSEQLTCYAALIMGSMSAEISGPVEVVQIVVQPRSLDEKVTRYSPSAEEINALVQKVTQAIATVEAHAGATESPLELLTVGSHCEYCPKQGGCPAHMQMMTQVVQLAQSPVPPDESEIPNLLYWMEMEDAIKGYLKKVQSTLLSHAEAGRPIPGKKLVTRYGNRQIALDDKLTESKFVSWFTRTFKDAGVSAKELKNTSLKSPAQLEAVLKEHKALDKAAKAKLAEKVRREVTGVKLVDITDKGDAVDPLHIPAFLKALEESQNE